MCQQEQKGEKDILREGMQTGVKTRKMAEQCKKDL